MMQVNEWLSNMSKIINWKQYALFLSTNYSKGGTHAIAPKVNNFRINFKCIWKGGGFEQLTPIAFNKNEQESNKNLEVMKWAIKAQFPR
jgi:hypothetical protein